MVRQADTEMTVVKDEVLYSQIPRNRRCSTQFRGGHTGKHQGRSGIQAHERKAGARIFVVVFVGRNGQSRGSQDKQVEDCLL